MEIFKTNNTAYHLTLVDTIDSTNILIKKLLRDKGASEGTVILAESQSHGKGQGGKRWHSEAGLNLTLSLLIQPDLTANRFFAIAEFVSIAIVETLYHFDIQAKIKWPNDIYVGNGKIAGILIENMLAGALIQHSIIGIGLNINEMTFPGEIPNAISMAQLLDKKIPRQLVLDVLLEKLDSQRNRLKNLLLDLMHINYNQLLYRRGEKVQFMEGERIFEAAICDVAEGGELTLNIGNGEYRTFLFGEIQMII